MIGVVGLIHRLHAAGTRIAIASNGSRRYLQHVVDHLDVGGLIHGFICADDVTHPKPHPEPYQKAVALLDLARGTVRGGGGLRARRHQRSSGRTVRDHDQSARGDPGGLS